MHEPLGFLAFATFDIARFAAGAVVAGAFLVRGLMVDYSFRSAARRAMHLDRARYHRMVAARERIRKQRSAQA